MLFNPSEFEQVLKDERNKTIERCARVAMECRSDASEDERRQIAAAIRALKDEP